MSKKRISKLLAGALAAFMVVQSSGLQYVAAEETTAAEAVPAEETAALPQLQSAAAVIPAGSDAETVKELLGEALVVNADQVDLQSLEWEYYCTGKNGLLTNDAWGSVGGFTSEKKVVFVPTTFTHPALADNEDRDYQVRLAGTETAVTLTKKAKMDSSIVLNEGCSVTLPYNDDLTVDYEKLRSDIFDTVVASTEPQLSYTDVTIEYYATAKTGSAGNLGKAWMPLEGGTKDLLNYPAISVGTQKIRFSYAGTDAYSPVLAETDITVAERPAAEFILKEGPYSVGIVFNEDFSYNYEAIKAALYDAVIESTVPDLAYTDLTIEYNAALTDLVDNFKPLDNKDWSNLKKFGAGQWEIRFSWNGSKDYAGGSFTADVSVEDKRIVSDIVLKEGAAITFNMDAEVMKQAVMDEVIDWENSVLPNKDTLSLDDFTMQYYGTATVAGVDTGIPSWVGIEGGSILEIGSFPIMGAGEQKIRISYKGSPDYRPCDNAHVR